MTNSRGSRNITEVNLPATHRESVNFPFDFSRTINPSAGSLGWSNFSLRVFSETSPLAARAVVIIRCQVINQNQLNLIFLRFLKCKLLVKTSEKSRWCFNTTSYYHSSRAEYEVPCPVRRPGFT